MIYHYISRRSYYLAQKASVNKIQAWYRAQIKPRSQRHYYLAQKASVNKIQAWYHAQIKRRSQRHYYLAQKASVNKIQAWYRAQIKRRSQRHYYLAQKASNNTIQQSWYFSWAVMTIQDWFSAKLQASRAGTLAFLEPAIGHHCLGKTATINIIQVTLIH